MAALSGPATAINYMDTRNFTEPLFVFVIMVVAASRPILELVGPETGRPDQPLAVQAAQHHGAQPVAAALLLEIAAGTDRA
ncbi:hypothetical protein G6F31_020271 [Rhizopus arrhizus]|nr:hypothetical protein G6F31_020271 [Rhizopus arrhizus]